MKNLILISLILSFSIIVEGQNYVTPSVVTTLASEVDETSGLINLQGEIWTHNDSGDDEDLYQIDMSTGEVIRTVEVVNADNVDWEDITMDDTYVYIADVGNNDGSRTDLKIYRVLQSDIAENDEVSADEISFHYSDQTSFEPSYHNTNFDCEAVLHYQGNLYLFTKNWIDYQTNCYVVPKTPGNHEAALHASFDAGFLTSGACYVPASETVALIGYTSSGGSFTWLFKEFDDDDFFSGESTKLIWTVLSQIEGVCDAGTNDIYISSEQFSGFLDPTLYFLDLSGFLNDDGGIDEPVYSICSHMGRILISSANGEPLSGTIRIFNFAGAAITEMQITREPVIHINLSRLHGLYILVLETGGAILSKKILIP